MFVAPDAAQDNVILFATLECVYAGNLDLFIQVLLKGTIELHVVDDVGTLPFVRGDNTDLCWNNARFEELCDDLLNI